MEFYTKVDEIEGEKDRLEWALSEADERFRLQNEELIDENNALKTALQVVSSRVLILWNAVLRMPC